MTTNNPTGFCPRCNQDVLLTREDIDICLAIVLLIFTAGIGLLIYLAIYYSKAENRCVHCGTIVTAPQTHISYTSQPQIQKASYSTPINGSEKITGTKPNFCALCGEKLEVGANFCPNCGSQITEN
ncbi:MAG: zinc-ribbon domain-containing protein [Candidatus Hodarchaeota archaeon]